jgi:hypothetical protein
MSPNPRFGIAAASLLCLGLCRAFALAESSTKPTTQPSTEKVLYRKQLGEERELVVVRGPVTPSSAVKDLILPSIVNRERHAPIGFFTIDLEIRSALNPPLRLWSQRGIAHAERPAESEDYQVLDLAVLPNRVLLVITTGTTISLHDIAIYGGTRTEMLPNIGWSQLAAKIPAEPGRLSAKVSYDEVEKKVEVEVMDYLQDNKLHSVWRQKGSDEWTFEVVKRWEEKVPTTRPAGNELAPRP